MKDVMLPLSIVQGSTSVLEAVLGIVDRENERSAKQKLAETSIEFTKVKQAGDVQRYQFELAHQAGELQSQMLENERRKAELQHEIAIEQNRLEKAKLKVEMKKIEHQAAILKEWLNHLPEMIEYKKHKFDVTMEFLNKQLDYCYSYCSAERDAFLEHRKLCVEEQNKARLVLDTAMYSQVTKTIRSLDRNIKRINNEFNKFNEKISETLTMIQKNDNSYSLNLKQLSDLDFNTKFLN